MHSPKLKSIIAIAFIILSNPIHVDANSHPRKSYGDSLIIGEFVEPAFINPILTHSSISAALKRIIFDGLVKLNDRMEPNPHLAVSWENSPNGLRWTFQLRRGVKFHDGAELTSEDVKFTFDKINDPSINSPYISVFRNVKAVNAKDQYTVEIHLENALPSLPFYLDVGILPKHLLMGKDMRKTEFNYHPIGTGPFKMERWSKEEVILKANDDYFLGKPQLKSVKVTFFKNQGMVWAELMKGTVDCVFLTFSKHHDVIKRIPQFNVYSFLNPYYYIMAFNEDKILFRQKIVRQALNYAIDKERILSRVLRGKGQISSGTIYPQSWAHDTSIEPYPYDPKKALHLMEKAGWKDTNGNHILNKDGREFEFVLLIVEGDEVSRESALIIQQQLLDIGVRMKVKPVTFSMMYERFLSSKKFDASLLSIISDHPERNHMWWHSSQIDHGFNIFSYRNKKVDDDLDRGRTTLDRKERREIYHHFQREIHSDPPGVFLFWRDYLVGINKRFRGVKISPAGILNHINEWYVPKEEQKYR
jgi:peptide/nickel transport system substrate-binding protein